MSLRIKVNCQKQDPVHHFINFAVIKSMKLLMLILLCSGFFLQLHSQQPAHFSMANLNKYQINPAVSGFTETLNIVGVHRDQWNNISGGPSSQLLTAHFPIDIGRSAFGINFISDAIGVEKTLALSFSYAQLFRTDYGNVSIAIQAGAEQKSLDQSRLRTPEGTYSGGFFNHEDPLLGLSDISSFVPVAGVSGWFSNGTLDIGLSVRQISFGTHFSDSPISYSVKPEFSLYADYFLPVNENWFVIPSIHLYSDATQLQGITQALASFRNLYYGGIGLRGLTPNSIDAISVMAGIQINDRFTIYYNYDIGLSSVYNPNNQTHEFMIIYRSPKWSQARRKPPVIYNPRFLE